MTTHVYTDLNLSITIHPMSFDVVKRYDLDSVITAMKHILGVNKGEKLFNPDFGASLYKLLFELVTPASKILAKKIVSEELSKWEPRITITNISFNINEETVVDVTITFFLNYISTKEEEVTIRIARIR